MESTRTGTQCPNKEVSGFGAKITYRVGGGNFNLKKKSGQETLAESVAKKKKKKLEKLGLTDT